MQHHFSGPGAEAFLESITPSSISTLPPNQSTLSTLLHPETGGIVDDTVIARLPDKFYVVTNAGCREKDKAYLAEQLEAFRIAPNPGERITLNASTQVMRMPCSRRRLIS